MPRTCTVCTNKKRSAIDAALSVGTSYRVIADQYGLTAASTGRHARDCVSESLEEARRAGRIESGVVVADQLAKMRRSTTEILERRLETGSYEDDDLALKAIARRERQIELQARLEGKFQRAMENETDKQRKARQYEAAIGCYLDRARAAGLPATRETAIEDLARFEPEIKEYIN
jgi:hypothetical protein